MVDPSAFLQISFQVPHLNEQLILCLAKLSIEVTARESGTIVADDNSIWIDHWKYFDYTGFSKLLRLSCGPTDPLEEAFGHMWAVTLTRMDSSH